MSLFTLYNRYSVTQNSDILKKTLEIFTVSEGEHTEPNPP